CQHRESHPWTF
nr:immunoglobulin light chain junction region [Macaca mulatta]